MSKWLCATIKEIAKVRGGKRLPVGCEFADSFTPFPYLRVTNMVNSTIKNEIVYVKPEIEPIIRNYKVSKDDIYVTIAGTLGNFGTIPNRYDNAQLTENAAKITDINNAEYDKKYLVYSFNSDYVQKQIKKEIGIGGGVPKLALHRIERLKVKYPPLPHQRKIARILTTVDIIIEKTETALKKYKAIKQGMMHDLFTRGIDVKTGKLRPSYEDAPELHKESELGVIPKEWETDNLESLTTKLTDGSHFSPVPQEDGYMIGNVKDMTLYGFNYETCTRITKQDFLNLKNQNCQPLKNDVLLSKDGTIGRVFLFNGERELVVLSSIAIIRMITEIVPGYLSYVLKSEYFDKQLFALQSGSALKRIVLSDIKQLKIPYPEDKDEQDMIVNILKSIDGRLFSELSALAKYQKIKQSLMQDLLAGKKEVTPDPEDFDDEP